MSTLILVGEGTLWPIAFVLSELTTASEEDRRALVRPRPGPTLKVIGERT